MSQSSQWHIQLNPSEGPDHGPDVAVVPTRKVQVANAKLGPRHMDGQIDLAAAREILNVAVAAVLGPAGDGPGALGGDALGQLGVGGPGVRVERLGRLGNDAVRGQVRRGDQFGLAPVPLGQDLGRRRAAQDARVDEAGEFDAGDVTGRAVDAFEIPDCLGSGGSVSQSET